MGIEAKEVTVECTEYRYSATCDLCGKTIVEDSSVSLNDLLYESQISVGIKYFSSDTYSTRIRNKEIYHTPKGYTLCKRCRRKLVKELLTTISKINYLEKSDYEVFE